MKKCKGGLASRDDIAPSCSARTSNATDSHLVHYDIPSLLLSNCNRILNKLDELYFIISKENCEIIALTESWLDDTISDEVVNMHGYNVFRRDRTSRIGGGVICYVSNKIAARTPILATKNNAEFEIIWIVLRPKVLPRPLSVIILALLYCPPWYNAEMCRNYSNYIVDCFDELSRRYTNPCFLIVGDFNSLDCSFFSLAITFKTISH